MVALFGIFPVLAAAQAFGEIPHAAQLAIWSASCGVLSIGGVLLAARLTLGRWLSIRPIAMVLAGAGVVLSAIVHVVLQQWEIQRFGVAEPEYVGLTAALFALLIGLATATFGTLVAPRGDRAWPAAATIVGAVMVLAIVALNLPGLDDGLGTESLPLAIWLGLSAVYGFVTAVAALSRLRGD